MDRIYLDYAATTYVKDEVLEAMTPCFKARFGNPSSLYSRGREAGDEVMRARSSIARNLHAASKNEIYFTSCGTESDNWALVGAMEANVHKGKHMITTAAEHHAVLNTCGYLEKCGYEVSVLPVDEYGAVSAAQVKEALRADTVLVSVIYANNEVGTINPIQEIGEVTKKAGVLFHTDAVQAAGSLPIDVQAAGVDLLSLSAHKFYGPKGVGVLYVRDGVAIDPLLYGGAQERKKRAGTENVPEIVGMAKALELAAGNMQTETERLCALRDYMMDRIKRELPRAILHGHPSRRLANNVNLSLGGIQSEAALVSLDLAGVECSSGSACTSGSLEPSHVLRAMGKPLDETKCALRFTMGETTTKEQIDYVIGQLKELHQRADEMDATAKMAK